MAEDSYIDVARQRRTVNKLKALIDAKADKGDSKTIVISPANADKMTDDEATTLIDNWPNVIVFHSNYYYYPSFYSNGTYYFSRSNVSALGNSSIEYLPETSRLAVQTSQTDKTITVHEAGPTIATSDKLGFVSIDNMSIGYIVNNQIGVKASGINASKLAEGAVETAKIRNSAVTTTKIANGSVTKAKLGSDVVIPEAVTDDHINSLIDTKLAGQTTGITVDQLKTILASAYVADDGTVHFTIE